MAKTLLVTAIDFGTTFSGYAFSFRHEFEQDPLKINASSWTTGSRMTMSLKTSSTVLFRPDGTFDSFGFEAEDRYADLAMDEEHGAWYYYRRFKMMLLASHRNGGIHRDTKLKDETGKEMPAMDVFSAAIRYMRDHMMRSVGERMYDIQDSDVKWVLTVPAIWDDAAKQFMREAAVKAGIMDDRLSLALEPEAASMFCKHLPVERMVGGSGDRKITCFRENAKYLVLDAGGGTVDITLHEVQADGRLKELHRPTGGAWGGTTIDQAFVAFIESITGREVMETFRQEHQDDYIELMREFEVKKRSVEPRLDSKVTFKIPISLYETYRQITGKEIRDAVREVPSLSGKVTFAGDKMRAEAETVKSLFTKTNASIITHLKGIFETPLGQSADSILMVGGFSESAMLRAAVQEAFPDKRVIIPHEAGLAVLKGAVIFGHDSHEITSRIAKYTYGLKSWTAYDPKIHPREKMQMRNGTQEVRGAFCKLVEIGQPVSPDKPSEPQTYCPVEGHSGFAVKLFASTKQNPTFVDEEGSISVGEVTVDCRDKYGNIGGASVSLVFGGTELEVRAVNNSTRQLTKANFDFL